MSPAITEADIEHAALATLEVLGYAVISGPTIAPEEPGAERGRWDDVVLRGRLRAALARLNPGLPASALDDAVVKVLALDAPTLTARNERFHEYLVNGVGVEVLRDDGTTAGETVWLLDAATPRRNDWLAVNQFTVVENGHTRRADIVLFVNGLPLSPRVWG